MKKRIIILLLVLTLLVVFVYSFIDMKTIYLGSNTKVYAFGSKVIKKNNNKKIILKKVNIYKDSRKIKGYLKTKKGTIIDNEYYTVSDNNTIIRSSDLIAAGTLAKINVLKASNTITEKSESAISEVNSLLDLNIKYDNVQSYKKVSVDLDNDSSNEDVISITYSENSSDITRIFINSNDNVTDIINYEVDYNVDFRSKIYRVAGFIDFNNDNKYEILISSIDGDSHPTVYSIYQYNNGIVKEIR